MANKKITFELDVDGKPIDVVIDKTLNLKQQVRELTKELNRTQEGTDQFRLLSSKLNETKDNVDRVNAKSREFFSTLSLLPGPVGDLGNKVDGTISLLKTFSGFKLTDIKNQIVELGKDIFGIGSAILKTTGITRLWEITTVALSKTMRLVGIETTAASFAVRAFSAALISTGIGALVVLLGTLVSALMSSGDAAEHAAQKMELYNAQLEETKRKTKLRYAEETARAKSFGATETELFELKQKQRQQDLDAARTAYKQAKTFMEANSVMYGTDNEAYRKAAKSKADAAKEIDQLKSDMLIGEYEEITRLNKKKEEEDKKNKDKAIALNKQQREKLTADNKTADEFELNLLRETNALKEQDERKREDKELENQKKAEEDKINSLSISETRKKEIIKEIGDKYASKQILVDKKRKEDDAKEAKDWEEKLNDLRINAIKNQQEREKAELQKGYNKTKEDLDKALNDKKISQAQYDQGIIDAKKVLNNATEKIDEDKRVSDLEKQLQLDESRLKSLKENTMAYFEQQRVIEEDNYKIQLERTIAGTKEREKVEQDHANVMKAIDKSSAEFKQQQLLATLDMYQQFGSALQQLAGKNKALAKTGLLIEKAAGIASIIINTQKKASEAGYFSPLGIATIIAGAASVATSIAAAMKGIQEIDGSGGGNAAPSASAVDTSKPNYGEGGLLEGPRHAQGGLMINAEGGEAVMTRGAVTMFQPLLSAMNVMGGGTSFTKGAAGQASYDNPKSEIINSQPQIIKTYVVSNELTTDAERQARLKDLSTL